MWIANYEVLGEIARGGFGAVYRARDPQGQEVAIKVLLEQSNFEEIERFLREGQATTQLKHPNVVRVHGVGRSEGRPYLVMDLIVGQNLAQRIQATGPLAEGEAVRIVSEIAAAVQAAHSLGILHRDLKPQNVLLKDGRPILTDFGLARIASAHSLTQTGEMLGTPGYMGPEQIQGELEKIGPSTDVYGLGAILYACLTGAPPFHEATPLATLDKALREDPAPPSTLRPVLDRELERICLRCLARDERERYSSAAELIDDLDTYATPRPASRRLWLLGALALIGGAAGLGVAQLGPPPSPPVEKRVAPESSASKLVAEGRRRAYTDIPHAEALFLEALKLEPSFPAARIELSLLRTRLCLIPEAEALLVGIDPSSLSQAEGARFHFARGLVLFDLEGTKAAHASFVKADELDPHQAPYLAWRGLSSSPPDRKLLAAARRADEHEPAVALFALAAIGQQESEATPDEFAALFAEVDLVLERSPSAPQLRALSAQIRFNSGEREEGLAQAEALRERWPKHVGVLFLLGRLYAELARHAVPEQRSELRRKASVAYATATKLAPWNRNVAKAQATFLSEIKSRPQAFAAWDALAQREGASFDDTLKAYLELADWLQFAVESRDPRGFSDADRIVARGRELFERLASSPARFRETPYGATRTRHSNAKAWYQVYTGGLYALLRRWDKAQEALDAAEPKGEYRGRVLKAQLLCMAERLRNSVTPDPDLVDRQRRDLRRAERYASAATAAAWLGASSDPPIWVTPSTDSGRRRDRALQQKWDLHRALREEGDPTSPRVLSAWQALVEAEPNNVLARVAYCEALARAGHVGAVVKVVSKGSWAVQGDPLMIVTLARIHTERGRELDLQRSEHVLTEVLNRLPNYDLARAARVEVYLRTNRPQAAREDLEALKGRVSDAWYADHQQRVRALAAPPKER